MRFVVIMLFSLLLPLAAQAAPAPCRFGSMDEGATTVDIASVYKAADAVVTGKVMGRDISGANLVFVVDKAFKGIVGEEVILRGHQPGGTEMNGFALPGNRELLLFLKSGTSGVYDNVEDYNSACNILFLIKDGKVVFIEPDQYNQGLEVAVDKVKDYLASSSPALVYKYK